MRMPDRFDVWTTILMTLFVCLVLFAFPMLYLHDEQVAGERTAKHEAMMYDLFKIERTLRSMQTSETTAEGCTVGEMFAESGGRTYVCVRMNTWRAVK